MDILIVEDDKVIQDLLCHSVRKWGHQAELAATGEDAVRQASQHIFDVILLDIMLPDGPSYEKIPDLKALGSDVNIITMTGYNTPKMERTVRSLGIAYYMAKPVNISELKHIIDHLSIKQAKRREMEVN